MSCYEPLAPRRNQNHYRTAAAGAGARLCVQLLRTADRLGVPASEQVSRRSLWGWLGRTANGRARRKQLALSFDLDYQADTDALTALVALLGRVGARATMFSIGRLVEQDPGPYVAALEAGHEIANHTWSHPNNPILNPDQEFWHLSTAAMVTEVGAAQNVFERALGVRPVGFRTPHFKDAHRMIAALEEFSELRYVSSTLASKAPLSVPYFPAKARVAGEFSLNYSCTDPAQNSGILMIPLTPCPEHRWSPFCSYHAIRRPAGRGAGLHTLADFSSLWQRLLASTEKNGFASVYFDPFDVMRDAETAAAFEAMLVWATEQGWELTALDRIESAWRDDNTATATAKSGQLA